MQIRHCHTVLAARLGKGVPAAALALSLAWGALADRAEAAQYCYGCVFNGTQEVPSNASPAIGGGQFLIDTDANTVTYRLSYGGLAGAETAAHFHGPADPGVNAGVVTALPAGSPKAGVWNYPEAIEGDILAGKIYANIHTAVVPGGEIRGQIVPLNAQLNGAQEVPATGSPGSGFGLFRIDTNTNTLSYYIAFGGLAAAETAAHIHGLGLHGINGGVLTALPAGSPKIGNWTYPEAIEADLLTGKTYVNIHTGAFPGGEIRGQICPIVDPLDGQQEVPANGSVAAGFALISYDDPANTLSYDVRFGGLTGAETAAHIHGFAPPGVNGGVLTVLPAGSPKLGSWVYGAADEAAVFDGRTYINIHSAGFPGGEIRGQIMCFLNAPSSSVPLGEVARAFQLDPSSPNPFTGVTHIGYRLTETSSVALSVFDAQGRKVRTLANGEQGAGEHLLNWDGRDDDGRTVASGVYWYSLETPAGRTTRSVSLVR